MRGRRAMATEYRPPSTPDGTRSVSSMIPFWRKSTSASCTFLRRCHARRRAPPIGSAARTRRRGGRRPRVSDNPVGKIIDAAVKKRPREVLPLVPPDVAIAGEIEVRLCADQEPCRLDRLIRAEQEVDAREDIERVREEIGRCVAQELPAILGAIEHRNDRHRQPVVS